MRIWKNTMGEIRWKQWCTTERHTWRRWASYSNHQPVTRFEGSYCRCIIRHIWGDVWSFLWRTRHISQPILQFEEHELVITSITLPPTSTVLITPDAAAVGDEASSSTASYDVVCVTIKLHRVNLLEEMISQFKDPALQTPPEIH